MPKKPIINIIILYLFEVKKAFFATKNGQKTLKNPTGT
jgi:hypothetical protein